MILATFTLVVTVLNALAVVILVRTWRRERPQHFRLWVLCMVLGAKPIGKMLGITIKMFDPDTGRPMWRESWARHLVVRVGPKGTGRTRVDPAKVKPHWPRSR